MSVLLILISVLIGVPLTSQLLILLGHLTSTPAPAFYGRSLASFFALSLCAAYGTLASACLNVVGYGGLGQWTTARAFKYTMLVLTRVDFEIEDKDGWLGQVRPVVFVGNHQTELDVLFLGHMFPRYTSVTAKKSLMWVPLLGWFMALSKTVFIERKSRSQAVAAFSKAAEQMHTHQQSVYIFPEGTRSYYTQPDLLPFKKGAFHLAVQAQVPIVPVVVGNYSNILSLKRKTFRSGTIPARVLKPVETKGKTKDDVDALLEEVRAAMLRELEDLTERTKKEGIAVKASETLAENVDGVIKRTGADAGYNAAAVAPGS